MKSKAKSEVGSLTRERKDIVSEEILVRQGSVRFEERGMGVVLTKET